MIVSTYNFVPMMNVIIKIQSNTWFLWKNNVIQEYQQVVHSQIYTNFSLYSLSLFLCKYKFSTFVRLYDHLYPNLTCSLVALSNSGLLFFSFTFFCNICHCRRESKGNIDLGIYFYSSSRNWHLREKARTKLCPVKI